MGIEYALIDPDAREVFDLGKGFYSWAEDATPLPADAFGRTYGYGCAVVADSIRTASVDALAQRLYREWEPEDDADRIYLQQLAQRLHDFMEGRERVFIWSDGHDSPWWDDPGHEWWQVGSRYPRTTQRVRLDDPAWERLPQFQTREENH